MDVGHVEPSGVSSTARRNDNLGPRKALGRALCATGDSSIGPDARGCLFLVEVLNRTLERQDARRQQRVRAVREKLGNGELDDREVYRAVADAVLGSIS